MTFTIIKATPGLTTDEIILNLLKDYPQGLTVKELSDKINRPISMIQTCLKLLVACKKVKSKKIEMIKYYYLSSVLCCKCSPSSSSFDL
ncbi:MAG: hypothetical protein QNJ66_16840 [Crocosphaera sp.]|nr:hypothetical protein [Crocosphaera sp.]MDJ0581668.1 hypothetical protein [Crocosphaera sp.]